MELISLLLPILTDLINRKINDSDGRFWISVAVGAVFGLFFNWLNTQFIFFTALEAFNSITASIMVTFGYMQLSYNGLYKNSRLQEIVRGETSEQSNITEVKEKIAEEKVGDQTPPQKPITPTME
jgi:hypothetical protein